MSETGNDSGTDVRAKLKAAIRAVLCHRTGDTSRRWNIEAMADGLGGLPTELCGESLTRTRRGPGAGIVSALRGLCRQVMELPPDSGYRYAGELQGTPYVLIWRLEAEPDPEVGEHYGLYVQLLNNDEPEGMHTHPWPTASLVLDGALVEHGSDNETATLKPGTLVLRPKGSEYRLTVDTDGDEKKPALLLIATGGTGTRNAMGTGTGRDRERHGNTTTGSSSGTSGTVERERERYEREQDERPASEAEPRRKPRKPDNENDEPTPTPKPRPAPQPELPPAPAPQPAPETNPPPRPREPSRGR